MLFMKGEYLFFFPLSQNIFKNASGNGLEDCIFQKQFSDGICMKNLAEI